MRWWFAIPLWKRVLGGLVAGLLLALVWPDAAPLSCASMMPGTPIAFFTAAATFCVVRIVAAAASGDSSPAGMAVAVSPPS